MRSWSIGCVTEAGRSGSVTEARPSGSVTKGGPTGSDFGKREDDVILPAP